MGIIGGIVLVAILSRGRALDEKVTCKYITMGAQSAAPDSYFDALRSGR